MPGDDDNCRGAVADSFKRKEMEEEGSLQKQPRAKQQQQGQQWSGGGQQALVLNRCNNRSLDRDGDGGFLSFFLMMEG